MSSSSNFKSRKGSNTQVRKGVRTLTELLQAPVGQQEPCATAVSNLLVPTEHASWRGETHPSIQSPQRWHQANSASDKSQRAEVQQQENVFGKHLFFTNSSNLEDKAPSLSPAPERGSHDTRATICHPVVKAQSSPLPAPAGTTVLACAPSWPRRDLLPLPAALISWQRCRRGRSHRGSSPGAPRPGGAAQLGG